MTPNQKFVYSQLLKGAFIAMTPTGGRPYTLYDPKMRPLKRLTDDAFRSIRNHYGYAEIFKTQGHKVLISRKAVRNLHKNSWLYKQWTTNKTT
jgi:hypothetical protein